MGLLCLIYLICALRTNIVFVLIFLFLVPAFGLLTGAFWSLAEGTVAAAKINHMLVAAGACTFVVCMLGWYLFFGILLASLDFPFSLPGKSSLQPVFRSEVWQLTLCFPVGDLSHIIKGASEKAKNKEQYSA
jgi:hypothetical protein